MFKSISVLSLAILISSFSINSSLAAQSAKTLLRLKKSTTANSVAAVRAEKRKNDERKRILGEAIKKQTKPTKNTFQIK